MGMTRREYYKERTGKAPDLLACVEYSGRREKIALLDMKDPRCWINPSVPHANCYKNCNECWEQPVRDDEAKEDALTYDKAEKEKAYNAMSGVPGLAPDVPVTVNDNGGKQSATPYGFHLLPVSSIFAAAEVAAYGANKYGEDFRNRNYTKISVEDHINHAIQHLYGYLAGDTSDDHLGHAIVRAMFAYDVARRNQDE